jgi:glycosyltransferase involved in cell wall biosynthesis
MRILHVGPLYYPVLGGAELHLREISEGLVRNGHQVTVLTTNSANAWDLGLARPSDLPSQEIINGVSVLRLLPEHGKLARFANWWRNRRGGHRSLHWLLSPSGYEMCFMGPRTLGVMPYLLKNRYDLVASMNWFWPQPYYCYLARKFRRFRLVGIPLFHTAEEWTGREIYRRMLRQCDAVVTNTGFEAKFALERGARAAFPIGVGINPGDFERRDGAGLRRAHGIGDEPVAGFIGRLTVNKGILTVIEAMRLVWRVNPGVRLLIAGPKPPDQEAAGQAIRALGPDELARVTFVWDFPDSAKASIFDAIDLLVLPSYGESFGIAYLEAWMCGKPVIGARIGPTGDVIAEGADGLLARPNDAPDVAERILELLRDPERRTRMGQAGRSKTLARFTWERVVNQMEQVYLGLARG